MTSSAVPSARSLTRLRAATPWAVSGVVLVALAALVLRFAAPRPIGPLGLDEWWHGIAGLTRGTMSYALAVFGAEVGGGVGAAACAAIAIALLLALRRPRDAAAVGTAMLLGVALSELIKAVVLRPRPWDQLYGTQGSSFPSGHSLGAAALAVSLVLVVVGGEHVSRTTTRAAWAVGIAWVLFMMWSRTALHVHWMSDVLAGALLGACVAILARRFWFRAVTPARGVSLRHEHSR